MRARCGAAGLAVHKAASFLRRGGRCGAPPQLRCLHTRARAPRALHRPRPPLACAGWVVLSLPAGTLKLNEPLTITRPQTVLRGAGSGRTRLAIGKPLREAGGERGRARCGVARRPQRPRLSCWWLLHMLVTTK